MTHHPTSHADLPSLLELAEVVATCIPFLPAAGQKNIGRVVEQMILIAQSGPEWMPIDSAPRDGTFILAVVEGFVPAVAQWTTEFRSAGAFEFLEPGMFAEDDHWIAMLAETAPWQPTHCLPLPPQPKESE